MDVILSWPFNVYKRFLVNFSAFARSLNSILKKDAEIDWGVPTNEKIEYFDKLEKNRPSPSILSFSKRRAPYMVDTDASQNALGAVLLQ